MIFLETFDMLTREEDEAFFSTTSPTFKTKSFRTSYATTYPFVMFRERELPCFEFKDITVFCGNNGSGKSTILNVIAEKLHLKREAVYNRSDFFDDYVELCRYSPKKLKLPPESAIITSDDVFERVLEIRRINDGVDSRRKEMIDEYINDRKNIDPEVTRLHGLDDYERWKNVYDSKTKTSSQYLRSKLVRNVVERSNGESALAYFVDRIEDDTLYLLDEPENSLSPSNQIALKYFIEDSVRNHGCQFIISTHSPFLLSLSHARIYDIDSVPAVTRRWTELECVRSYFDFFNERADSFK